MKRLLAWLAALGGIAAAYRALRRQELEPVPDEPDPRAQELRDRIAESRALVDERDEFEAAETTIEEAEPAALDERRRQVHERGRSAVDEMRGSSDG